MMKVVFCSPACSTFICLSLSLPLSYL